MWLKKKILTNRSESGYKQYLLAILLIAATATVCTPLSDTQNYHVVSFILLFVVSLLSTFLGVGPVLVAATLSAVAWNFFFIPPNLTFNIGKTEDVLIFGLFFIIALVNGVLTTRVRKQEKVAREREKRTDSLFQLTRELSKASGLNEVVNVSIAEIRIHFSLDSIILLKDDSNRLKPFADTRKEIRLAPEEYDLAEWVLKNLRKAGAFTDKYCHEEKTFFPLAGTKINTGVVAVKLESQFHEDQLSYWDSFLTQISNALEREFLAELAQKVRFLDESDRLYKTLFNSISHEFRIPVATIIGASETALITCEQGSIQAALCNEIFTASLRLNRLIENLLNISRLESGHISLRLDWCDVNDLFNKVAQDLKDELKPFYMKVEVQEDMPMVRVDFGLLEQVLYNLLLNSTQYAPGASEINLEARHFNNELTIAITDQGPGVPHDEIDNVFKKFFRLDGTRPGGLGLGLSIVKGFVEAHNGKIDLENSAHGGARFIIRIPSYKPDIGGLKP